MSSKWHQKREKEKMYQEELAFKKMDYDSSSRVKDQASDVAMGGGEDQFYEKKLTKEEKKALAKKRREEKKKAKGKGKKGGGDDDDAKEEKVDAAKLLAEAKSAAAGENVDLSLTNPAAEKLASEGTVCTFSRSRKGVDARSRDINVTNFTLQHKGQVMLDETEIVLNHGNRYGLLGRNGCGKSTFMRCLAARAVPIPDNIDIFHLSEEVEASDTVTAIDAVMSVDEERRTLEREADKLNHALSALAEEEESGEGGGGSDGEDEMTAEEQQEKIMDVLNYIYERLDLLDADTAEKRAREILRGLGFTHEMQGKLTRDFSGGWRMRVSLARALFIQPTLLLLDEPTNHLDMEAVIWLEDYLSRWSNILLLISHSQDFLNNVTTHTIHFASPPRRKLITYDGNYDQFVKTKSEKEENQLKQYNWEQDQIKSMKEYIARFGHGTAKNAKQAQSKQKVLDKMIRAGLTEKPEVEKPMNFNFPDPGHLPPPVLAFRDVSFAYPGCRPLYDDVNFGVDLDSRVALVGPNGAGKTTLVKLMSGELQPTLGDVRPHGHLKMGRFTQHFVDVLDLNSTPLEYFDKLYPDTPYEDQRKYLGRFGVSGKMQVQRMEELSDGQKSRVVFAKLGREVPHILLLDEPTNHLDMESIDALAKAVNEFSGGLVLVSHDMRLISQVAREIWICDRGTISPYKGDIQHFKMDMRAQMGIEGSQKMGIEGSQKGGGLRGDASRKKDDGADEKEKARKKKEREEAKKKKGGGISVIKTKPKAKAKTVKEDETVTTAASAGSFESDSSRRDLPRAPAPAPAPSPSSGGPNAGGRYVPPHLRSRG